MTTCTTRGTATLEVPPDRATLHLRVNVTTDSPDDTGIDRLNDAITTLKAVLDSHTARPGTSYEITGAHTWTGTTDYGAPRRHLSTVIVVTVDDDIHEVSEILGRALDCAGVELSYLAWGLQDQRQHERAARTAAVQDAKAAGEDYAAAIGMRVFSILSISDPGTGTPFGSAPRAAAVPGAGAASAHLDVTPPKHVNVGGSVEMTFKLVPAQERAA